MKLLTLPEVSLTNLDKRFRQSPIANLLFTMVILAMAGLMIFLVVYRDGPKIILLSIPVWLLFGCIQAAACKKSLGPCNWLLAIAPEGIYIKFRSYLNTALPETDKQVIALQFSDIQSVQIVKQTLSCPSSGGKTTTTFMTFLDIHLQNCDISILSEQLCYERSVWNENSAFGGRTKTHDYPVSTVKPNIIRLEWRSPKAFITPGINKAIASFVRQGIPAEPKRRDVIDFTISSGDKKKMEEQILQLAEKGHVIAAIKLARKTYNYDLAEAKKFIDGLLK